MEKNYNLAQTFRDFSMFSHGFPSPQVKWKKIIITISKHTNCLTSFKTYDLKKLGNFKKILKMLVNKRKCPTGYLK